MKKIISLTLVVLLTLALVACNPNQEETEKLQQNVQYLQERLEQLEESNENMQEQISAQQKEKELLQKKLDNLMGEQITFIAEAPVYGPNEAQNTWGHFDNYGIAEDNLEYNPFEDLLNCYIDEISPAIENEICMLDPGDGEFGHYLKNGHRRKTYIIFVEGDGNSVINPMIKQHIVIKDEILGNDDYAELSPNSGDYSFVLDVFFAPVFLNNPYRERTLEFGNNATYDNLHYDNLSKTYFNIYIRETCIGTCYYKTNSYISAKWFSKYFNNKYDAKLYYGGLS